MNVGSIADKYFSDTLVEAGKLEDDNQDHIVLSTFSFGGVRPMDGHAIATVNILKKESEPMRVLLDQEDIQAALDAHVKNLALPGATGVELTVTDDGKIEAEVLMGEAKPKNKGGRPRGSKTRKPTTTVKKPAPEKEEDANVDEAGEDNSEGSGDVTDSGGDSAPETTAEEGSKEPSKGKTTKGNLFGDSDEKGSSDSQTTSEDETPKETGSQASKVKTKKSSIFDVD